MTTAATMLERLCAVAEEWRLANLQPQIVACRNQIVSRDGIEVAVYGRFKAGKSSFLNHLIGRDVLPIGVVPLTAVITRLRYGETERAEVRFLDGTSQAVPVSEIRQYVTENENPNNGKQVASVQAELPGLKSLAPLQFVDTPGLGSAFAHNTEAAMNWLPNVAAAVVAVSADAPLSERDLSLLEELRCHTPRTALLLTKADLLTETQRTDVRDFVMSELRRRWSETPPVFFYSIKSELAAMKTALMAELLQPLREHKREACDEILRHKLTSLRNQMLNYLGVALAAATQVDSARQKLRECLDEEHRQFGVFREELQVMTHEWSANALDHYLTALLPFQRALRSKVTIGLAAEFAGADKLNLPRLLQTWRACLQSFLTRELGQISRAENSMFCQPAQKAREHLTRTVRAFHDRLAGHVQAALGITLIPCEFSLDVQEPAAPPVDVNFAFDAAFTTMGLLIPLSLFRGPIERALMRKAEYEVEKNISRLAADWSERVGHTIDELRRQTEEAVRSELETLAQMQAQTSNSRSHLMEVIAELKAMRLG